MQTLERAAALLRGATSLDRVADILSELGFPGAPLALDRNAISALDLPNGIRAARITQGSGALRGLAIELAKKPPSSANTTRVANGLARNASQMLLAGGRHP